MSGERYTQIKRPVSRLTEKLLGWFSWIFLLILTVITMFIALVSFSNDTSIQNLENSMNNNELIQQILTNNSLNTTQFVIWLQNGVWAIIVYFIVCLLISFLALISMNMRMLSGFLFLIASIITLPLVLLFVTLIIPIFFFIIAIMMFARKSKVETVPMYGPSQGYEPHYYPRDEYNDYDDRYYGSNRNINDDYGYDNHNQYDDYEQDDVEPPHKTKKSDRRTRRKKPYYNDDIDNNYRDNNFDDTTQRNDAEQDLATDTEEDKYNQYPKRAITDEYHTDANENEATGVLSRQAKYNQKSNKQSQYDNNIDEDSNDFAENVIDSEPKIDKKEEKAQRKREKAELKAKKKEKRKAYNQRMKERRKNQPSAVSQRRMNYEERKQILNKDDIESDKELNNNEDNKD
ncbi:lipoteichoic acid stability factor AuxB [Staphylococcus borealis]|uniref:lipoteichoic acid stability factor AuxB n=1 Tax=Staphylococcus borealis TaxID=2742203 RepID=UPI00374F97BE